MCVRERHPVRLEPEPLDAHPVFLVCIQTPYTVPRFCVCLEPSAYRAHSYTYPPPRQSRERETHTHTAPHTHRARAGARAPRGFSGGFCVPEIFALRATVTYQRVEADG